MKIYLCKSLLLLLILLTISCTSVDDEFEESNSLESTTQMQSYDVNSHSVLSKQEFMNLLKDHYSSNDLSKNDKTKNDKPFWTAEYSNFFTEQGEIFGAFPIPGTNMIYIYDFPINGDDKIHVKGDEGKIVWNIKEPKVFIVDLTTGLVLYSNWCENKRMGFFKQILFGPIDYSWLDPDGSRDIYPIKINDFDGSHFNVHIKTVLTDAQNSEPWLSPVQGDCTEPTVRVDFEIKANKKKNEATNLIVELAGKKYERTIFE